jgi:hypothetical protein
MLARGLCGNGWDSGALWAFIGGSVAAFAVPLVVRRILRAKDNDIDIGVSDEQF